MTRRGSASGVSASGEGCILKGLPLDALCVHSFKRVSLSLPSATKLGQGYVFTGVCDSVHRGWGVPDQVHPPGTGTPQDQVHPPGTRYTPPGPGTCPGTRYSPDQVHPQDQVHLPEPGTPPGPGTPPSAEHAGRYGQCAGGTHPTGMQSCCFINLCLLHIVAEQQ